jgi:hypothetical protein
MMSTSTRNAPVTATSMWLFSTCDFHVASSAGVPPAAIFASRPRAMARKPTGAGLKIFIQPAVIVTDSSQASGASVTQSIALAAHLDEHGRAEGEAMTASSWFATPKIGQSELMPPSGSTTPW